MVEQVEAQTPTKDELLLQMNEAIAKGDFKAVTQLSRQITKVADVEDKAELVAKQDAVANVTETILNIFTGILGSITSAKPLSEKRAGDIVDAINLLATDKALDLADGVWFAWDFGENLKTCKLLKKAIVAHKAGGGAGKRFSVNTEELLGKYGSNLMGDTGKTYQEAWDESTEKNHRYQVRVKLIKLDSAS